MKTGEMPQGKVSLRSQSTANILLEGAAWNFINIRRTARQHNLPSEASFRFSRGVHPAMAETGVKRGLQYMALWSGGIGRARPGRRISAQAKGPDDHGYARDVKRLLGFELSAEEIVALLEKLEFKCTIRATENREERSRISQTQVKTSAH